MVSQLSLKYPPIFLHIEFCTVLKTWSVTWSTTSPTKSSIFKAAIYVCNAATLAVNAVKAVVVVDYNTSNAIS